MYEPLDEVYDRDLSYIKFFKKEHVDDLRIWSSQKVHSNCYVHLSVP
uniref:Uncharacterized protein n=1 Tax=Parascaris equorum TaxID=6256 RepID=A0A914RRS8_PAREQ